MAKRDRPDTDSQRLYMSNEEVSRRIYERLDHIEIPEEKKTKKQEKKWELLLPQQVKSHLDRYVISQEQAKRDLSVAVAYHYNKVMSKQKMGKKNNVLLIGPTGVGKTYLLEKVSKIIDVPFIEVDITKYTQTGYVGLNIEEIFKYLLVKTKENLDAAQKAIIYIDEVDKLNEQTTNSGGKDINGYAVQTELLKILEGTELPLSIQHGQKIIPIDTRNILFVCSGAFPRLPEIIKKRLKGKTSIGFSGQPPVNLDNSELLNNLEVDDLANYGLLREFIGRLPVRTILSPLTKDDMKKILTEPSDSIIKHYQSELSIFGIKLKFADDALDLIAEKAYKDNLGARALHTICEGILKDFKYALPGSGIKHLTITKDIAQNPRQGLEALLKNGR